MHLTFHLIAISPLWKMCLYYEYLIFIWRRTITFMEMREEFMFLNYQLFLSYAKTKNIYYYYFVREYYDVVELAKYKWVDHYKEVDQERFGRFITDPYYIVFFFFGLHFLYRFFGTWEVFGVNYWIRFARFEIITFLIFTYLNFVTWLLWNENFFYSPIMVYIMARYYWEYTCFFDPFYHYQEMEIIGWDMVFTKIDIYYYIARRILLIVYPVTGVICALAYTF